MDIKNYISSGILEQYVLGELSIQQQQEVEANAKQYPEIKAELEAIEDALESVAQAAAVAPPPGLGLIILESLDDKTPTPPAGKEVQDNTKVKGFNNPTIPNNPPANPFRGISFVTGILLLGASLWGFVQFNNSSKHEKALSQMTEQFTKLEESCNQLKINNTHIAFLKDIKTTPILMAGTDKSPESSATVFWNKELKKAYLDTGSMPTVPTGKQYQLWAIVEGKPVDMGVFDPINDDTIFIEVPFIEAPQAFAVTLEKEGGNPTPTMEEMYVLGEV